MASATTDEEVVVRSEDQVAQYFMERKGHGDLKPISKDKLEGFSCWYFVYRLPDQSVLELEVEWRDGEWSTLVSSFTPHREGA